MIDSVFRTGKSYYPQVFLEESKFIVKEKKMPEYITDDIEIFSDNSDTEDSETKYRMRLFLYLKHFKWF